MAKRRAGRVLERRRRSGARERRTVVLCGVCVVFEECRGFAWELRFGRQVVAAGLVLRTKARRKLTRDARHASEIITTKPLDGRPLPALGLSQGP